MFSSIKNAIGGKYRDVVGGIKKPHSESKFYEKGVLTPEEFEAAGDKLCFVCPSWQWNTSANSKLNYPYLPEEKQYLSTKVVSAERIKEVFDQIEASQGEEDGWIVTSIKEEYKKKYVSEVDKTKLDEVQDEKPELEPVDFDDLDAFDETADDEIKEAPKEEKVIDPNSKVRHYDISITYDKYYYTPRLWLSGVKENGQPLTNEEIFEDIMSEYINKTVTIESHPNIGTSQASIHPCKHADVIHTLVTEARQNGNDIGPDQALFIFLKFMSSVIPTLEFDHTTEISLNS